MIKIEVEPYCHSCLDFSPDVSKPERCYLGNNEIVVSDTIIKCEYRKRCAGLYRYLEQKVKEG